MSGPEPKETHASVHDIAVRIYVELCARNTQVTEGAVKMVASAANLAALSLKLAEAFIKSEEDFAAAKAPDTTYKLGGDDIAAWMK
jgi:hypothetical protein